MDESVESSDRWFLSNPMGILRAWEQNYISRYLNERFVLFIYFHKNYMCQNNNFHTCTFTRICCTRIHVQRYITMYFAVDASFRAVLIIIIEKYISRKLSGLIRPDLKKRRFQTVRTQTSKLQNKPTRPLTGEFDRNMFSYVLDLYNNIIITGGGFHNKIYRNS